MNSSDISLQIYREFHTLCRVLTYMTVALVCLVAGFVWLFDIDVRREHTTLMGIMFMILAAFTFKIPYFSYRYLISKYKHQSEESSVLGVDWKQFREQAMQHR